MQRLFTVTMVFFFLTAGVARGVKVGGVHLPETLSAGNTQLMLNGAGVRKKFFIKVYAAGLYLTQKSKDAGTVIETDAPMAMRMHFIYDGVTPKQLMETFNEGFSAVTGGDLAPMQEKIDAFNAFFTKEAKKDDRYDFIYLPESGVTLFINEARVGSVPGLDFKKLLFSVWLGKKPADDGLKKNLLGK